MLIFFLIDIQFSHHVYITCIFMYLATLFSDDVLRLHQTFKEVPGTSSRDSSRVEIRYCRHPGKVVSLPMEESITASHGFGETISQYDEVA